MNILYIDHYAGGLPFGMEFRPYYLGREWIKKGHKVRVIAGDYSHLRTANPAVTQDLQIDNIDGLEYQWFKTGRYQGNGTARAVSIFRFSWKLYKNAKLIADEFNPDVVISSSTYPLDTFGAQKIVEYVNAKRINSGVTAMCRYIHEGHDLWPLTLIELGGMSKWHPFVKLLGFAERVAYSKAEIVVSVLPGIYPHMLENGFDADTQAFLSLPNGVVEEDWDNLQPLSAEVAAPLQQLKEDGKFIVCYLGGHAISNALDCFVEAAKMCDIPDVSFVLIGKGIEKQRLMDMAKGLDNILFLPAIPKTQVPSALAYADVLYVGAKPCSLYRYGVSMNKMYDYMMSGRPIINGVDASNDDVADANCGIKIEPESPQAIIGAVVQVKGMALDERKNLGANGRKWVLANAEYKVLADKFLITFENNKFHTEDGLVSIVMPSWNTARFIGKSIESVLCQTYTNWELIIVDDCSSDNTDEIVAEYTDGRIRYIKNETNSGAALTRNRAIREARGEWIAFLDSDDLWEPQKLEKQIEFMKQKGYVFSYHEYVKIDEDDAPLNIYVSGPEVVTRQGMYNYGYPGCLTFMYSARFFGRIQIKDIKKNNDYAMLLKLCKKADCYLLKENLAQYRIRKKSISHDKLRRKLKSHFDLFHKCDGRNAITALWYACWNMYYGVQKKRRYEKRTKS